MTKLSCGQSFAAWPTSFTLQYPRRWGNWRSTEGGKRPLWMQMFLMPGRSGYFAIHLTTFS